MMVQKKWKFSRGWKNLKAFRLFEVANSPMRTQGNPTTATPAANMKTKMRITCGWTMLCCVKDNIDHDHPWWRWAMLFWVMITMMILTNDYPWCWYWPWSSWYWWRQMIILDVDIDHDHHDIDEDKDDIDHCPRCQDVRDNSRLSQLYQSTNL